MNKYEEALRLFREIAKSSQDRSIAERAQYQIGWCYYRMNKDMEAADNFGAFMRDIRTPYSAATHWLNRLPYCQAPPKISKNGRCRTMRQGLYKRMEELNK